MQIRYAVVGLGHIAQVAVLPAFKHAKTESHLSALVSGDPLKLQRLGKKYHVKNLFSYDEYERLLSSNLIDAVYIALPNHLHYQFASAALRQGIHVLCEKPLALHTQECKSLIALAEKKQCQLMTAYRLHFDAAILKAIEIANSGKIGQLRYFSSTFSYRIHDENNIRLIKAFGGGPLWDIGIYCINAARNIFRSEPLEVFAMKASSFLPLFDQVEESATAILKFPEECLASFTCSFGTHDSSEFKVFGTKGSITLQGAYEYAATRKLIVESARTKKTYSFQKSDQFAPELVYFSQCILDDKLVEPSGEEGLADTMIIEALHKSAQTFRPVHIPIVEGVDKKARPTIHQKIFRPSNKKPEVVYGISL